MLTIDPFDYLATGLRVQMNVGEKLSLPFVVERVERHRQRLHVVLEGDGGAADGVEFVGWRVYMLSCQHQGGDLGPIELAVPTELKALGRAPVRMELRVMPGTSVIQRRSSYRVPRPDVQAAVRVDGEGAEVEGDVIDLGASGMALGTPAAPPPKGAALAVTLRLPDGAEVPVRGRLVGAARPEGGPDWRWQVQFDELAEPARTALLLYIYRERR